MKSIPDIKNGLDTAFNEVIQYVETQPDHLFEAAVSDGKWTTGQQIEHLIKSVSPIILGLKPDLVLSSGKKCRLMNYLNSIMRI